MTKKNIIVLLAVAIVLASSIFVILRGNEDTWICENGGWVKHGNPSAPKPETGCGENIAINFDETGHFVKDNPGMKPGVWFLVYEKPGSPALSKELNFDEESVCEFNKVKGKCPDILFLSSALTHVRGVEKDNVVKVVTAISG